MVDWGVLNYFHPSLIKFRPSNLCKLSSKIHLKQKYGSKTWHMKEFFCSAQNKQSRKFQACNGWGAVEGRGGGGQEKYWKQQKGGFTRDAKGEGRSEARPCQGQGHLDADQSELGVGYDGGYCQAVMVCQLKVIGRPLRSANYKLLADRSQNM